MGAAAGGGGGVDLGPVLRTIPLGGPASLVMRGDGAEEADRPECAAAEELALGSTGALDGEPTA